MKFIDVAIPKFSDNEAPHDPAVPRPTAPEPSKHPSFRRHPIEEYTLEDNHSMTSAKTTDMKDEESSVDEKGGDQFYEARDDTTEVSKDPLSRILLRVHRSLNV